MVPPFGQIGSKTFAGAENAQLYRIFRHPHTPSQIIHAASEPVPPHEQSAVGLPLLSEKFLQHFGQGGVLLVGEGNTGLQLLKGNRQIAVALGGGQGLQAIEGQIADDAAEERAEGARIGGGMEFQVFR